MKPLASYFLSLVACLVLFTSPALAQVQLEVELSPPSDYFKVGEFKRIYDPSVGEDEPWYINDHCLIQEKSGKWHMFGITREEPAKPMEEIMFAHATADKLTQQPWKKEPHVLHVAKEEPWKEVHVWAPHVVAHDGLYYMYYCAGGESNFKYRIHLATSPDLKTWTRHPKNPMLIDGFDARDPMVRKEGEKWVMYYTATRPVEEGNHVVVKVTSDDLVKWEDPKVVFTHERVGKWGGPTESPYVVTRNGWHYLFVCMNPPYDMTAVYRSRTPDLWEEKDKIGQVGAHCAEVVELPGDKWYVTRAGWGRGGLFLAELEWLEKADEGPGTGGQGPGKDEG